MKSRTTIPDLKSRFGLNDSQAAFALYYTGGETVGNGTASWRKAYPESGERAAKVSASQALAKPNLQAAVAYCQQSVAERVGVSAEKVLDGLLTVAGRCLQAERVVGADGSELGVYKFEAAGANRALELLGKHLHLFDDRMMVVDHRDIIARLAAAKDREGLRRIAGGEDPLAVLVDRLGPAGSE